LSRTRDEREALESLQTTATRKGRYLEDDAMINSSARQTEPDVRSNFERWEPQITIAEGERQVSMRLVGVLVGRHRVAYSRVGFAVMSHGQLRAKFGGDNAPESGP